MNKILSKLKGKKTYIGIVALAGYYLASQHFGFELNDTILTAIATWTGVSMRLAIKKAE